MEKYFGKKTFSFHDVAYVQEVKAGDPRALIFKNVSRNVS